MERTGDPRADHAAAGIGGGPDHGSVPRAVAYVLTHYPRRALTFIAGEIDQVERCGVTVLPVVMNRPIEEDLVSAAGRRRRQASRYLKRDGWGPLIAAAIRAFGRHPIAFVGLAVEAIRSAGPRPGQIARRLAHLTYGAATVEHCRANGATHLHAHFGLAPASIAWFAATIGNWQDEESWTWSFTIHGFQDFADPAEARLDLKARSTRFVVCVSEYTESQLRRVTDPSCWDRFHVIRCGLDLAHFPMRGETPMAERPLITTVARLAPEKDHVTLLDAMRRLLDDGMEVKLDVVGDGPCADLLFDHVEALDLGENVTFRGEIEADDVRDQLRRSDVFCLPSLAEGLPVSIMEAMAVGVPVVATRVAGIPELVVDGQTGLTVAPGDPDALAAALRAMLADPHRSDAMARRARAAVEEHHDRGRNVDELLRLFPAPRPDESAAPETTLPTSSATPADVDPLERAELFGLRFIDAGSVDEVIDVLLAFEPDRACSDLLPVVVTPNVDQVVRYERHEDTVARELAHRARFVLPDGQPIVWASPLLGKRLHTRLPGSTLVEQLWPAIVSAGRPAVVVANSPTTAALVREEGPHVDAIDAPMLDADGIERFAIQCNRLAIERDAEFVFVTLGFPKTSQLIAAMTNTWPAGRPQPLFLGIGASFDMYYGLVRRAPLLVQRLGMEWLFRFAQEPRRLFRRYFVDDVAFFGIVLREALERQRANRDAA